VDLQSDSYDNRRSYRVLQGNNLMVDEQGNIKLGEYNREGWSDRLSFVL